jgi:hypothetical protein
MLVQLTINDLEFPAFKNIIEHLKDGMVEQVSVLDTGEASFVVSSVQVVRERVQQSEVRGSYTDHDSFWDGLTVDSK